MYIYIKLLNSDQFYSLTFKISEKMSATKLDMHAKFGYFSVKEKKHVKIKL